MQSASNADGRPALRTEIRDLEGDGLWFDTAIMPDNADPQKMGSSVTYFRRYSLVAIFMMEAKDDDGQSAKSEAVSKPAINNDDLDF